MNVIELRYGEWYDAVYLDGRRLDPAPSLALFNHSPDGFSWGYGGSGPSQLALAILLAVTGEPELSVRLHQNFKRDHVERWPDRQSGVLKVDVLGWVRGEQSVAAVES